MLYWFNARLKAKYAIFDAIIGCYEDSLDNVQANIQSFIAEYMAEELPQLNVQQNEVCILEQTSLGQESQEKIIGEYPNTLIFAVDEPNPTS